MKVEKIFKKILLAVLIFGLILPVVPAHKSVAATKIKLSKTKVTLYVGSSRTLELYKGRKILKATWTSSEEKIATVGSATGVVTAKSKGTCKITAKYAGKKYTCKVTVKGATSTPEPKNAKAEKLTFTVSDGGALLQGGKADITFCMDADTDVTVCVMNAIEEVVYETSLSVKKGKDYTVNWTPDSSVAVGTYYVKIKAGTEESISENQLILHINEFAGGTGSEETPFLVESFEQFKLLEKYNGYFFRQIADIDCNGSTYVGMFSESNPFSGTYDGDGKILKNLFLANSDSEIISLFHYIGESGCIKNLNLSKIYVTGTRRTTILSFNNSGNVNNCRLDDCHVSAAVSGKDSEAAILVLNNRENAAITGCTITNSTVAASYGWYKGWTGGIVANNYGKLLDCTIKDSSVKTTSTSYGWAYGGGLVSYNAGNMLNCIADNVVLDSSSENCDYSGGICAKNKGLISHCSFVGGSAKNTGIDTNDGTFIS